MPPGHNPHLAHHFRTPAQQYESSKLGMWIFLATEVLLFGGLFCAYSVFRANHREVFVFADLYLDKALGACNTVVLICSSLTMAWAVRCAQTDQPRPLAILLGATLLLAACFLGIKFIEYRQKWQHGLLWARKFKPEADLFAPPGGQAPGIAASAPGSAVGGSGAATQPGAGLPASPNRPAGSAPASSVGPKEFEDRSRIAPAAVGPSSIVGLPGEGKPAARKVRTPPENLQLFFSLYFLMTGLHGLHVIGGMTAITWLLIGSLRRRYSADYFTPVDLVGLYWHLVDMIWIYLFPLLYLIR